MEKLIGVVGEIKAGKGTFAEILKQELGDRLGVLRFSDILWETLALWQLKTTRENLQKLSISMVQTYGEGTLSDAVCHRIISHPAEIVLADGVRWKSDVQLIRGIPGSQLIYVTTRPEIRFARLRAIDEKVGDRVKTWEEFLAENSEKTEVDIAEIGKSADITLVNNDSYDQFKSSVLKFASTLR